MIAIVADSSYIIEGLLKDKSLFEGYGSICSPDFGLYEVLNTVWMHQVLSRQIQDGEIIIAMFFDLIATERIRFMTLEQKTIMNTYQLAVKTKKPFYDTAFIVLARELGMELKTFDKEQAKAFKEDS